MMGTRTPNLSSVSTIFGTAAAACSVFTVTRTNSEPACASAITWFTVDCTSTVSVLVIDCTTIGCDAPHLDTAHVDHYRLTAGFYSHASPPSWKP